MSFKDLLLPLVGEPNEQAIAAIEKCVAVAGGLSARIEALAIEEDVSVRPKVASPVVDGEAIEDIRSTNDTRGLLRSFDDFAVRFGARHESMRRQAARADVPELIARRARLKDLSFVPVKADDSQTEEIVECLLFESGRPVLLCPEELAADLPVAFDDILIAWDHSAPAATAIADALPWLQSASTVRIMTATDQPSDEELRSGAALVDHLAEHGIRASFETVKIDGSSIGKVFEAHVRFRRADLLVMGAYRHSRLNEIIWGGATKTVIGRPPCWTIMSR
jgi:nucleotide-binding universal stress UspA family protein